MTRPQGALAITMAGFGRRFVEAGLPGAKYEIEVFGRPLFDWALLGLCAFSQAGWRLSVAARRDQGAGEFVQERCRALGWRLDCFLELDSPTDGQATTALALAGRSEPAAPFAVFNIDTFVAPGAMRPSDIPADAVGWIPCFPGRGDGWSFVSVQGARAAEVKEKSRISPHASVGLYWFSKSTIYIDTYRKFFSNENNLVSGEKYIAPMYNQLIEQGAPVYTAFLDEANIGLLGTPEQVAEFSASPPHSARPYALR